MLERVGEVLNIAYGIQTSALHAVPSGWSAAAWSVHSDYGDYFLKIYDKRKPSSQSWIARIDRYMPIVLWLHENTLLRGKMIAPLLTKDGRYKFEDEAFLYLLFPFIDGQTIGDAKLNPEQIREIAQITARLHTYGAEIPVSTDSLKETFDLSFCTSLISWLENPQNTIVKTALTPYDDRILRAITALQNSADVLRQSKVRYALCHTDIHGWNLMQSKSLILIDWEGLTLAPVEADLFSFTESFFFEYAWEDFVTAYRFIHKDYQVNSVAMRFYRARRRLEDIHAFTESILFDNLSQEDINRSLYYLKMECKRLSRT